MSDQRARAFEYIYRAENVLEEDPTKAAALAAIATALLAWEDLERRSLPVWVGGKSDLGEFGRRWANSKPLIRNA